MKQRLSKILANHGVASRRHAEQLIYDGHVAVNGKIVRKVVPVDPDKDHIVIDGRPLSAAPTFVYYAFHKPHDVVTTMDDEKGRKSVADFVSTLPQRVFPVGRLDAASTGLLVLTNDGPLAQKIGHPRFLIDKTYKVTVFGIPNDQNLDRLRRGVILKEGKTSPAEIAVLSIHPKTKTAMLLVTIHEGRNRQVRRMFEKINHTVKALKRITIGPIELGDLPEGQIRPLTNEEITALKKELDNA